MSYSYLIIHLPLKRHIIKAINIEFFVGPLDPVKGIYLGGFMCSPSSFFPRRYICLSNSYQFSRKVKTVCRTLFCRYRAYTYFPGRYVCSSNRYQFSKTYFGNLTVLGEPHISQSIWTRLSKTPNQTLCLWQKDHERSWINPNKTFKVLPNKMIPNRNSFTYTRTIYFPFNCVCKRECLSYNVYNYFHFQISLLLF